jgi:hypothetical protein
MRRRARRLILFGLIGAAWFAVFEAGLRRWGTSEAAPAFQGLFTGDPVLGYRLQPGARTRFTTSEFETEIAITDLGVRDDEEIGPKPPGERRVLVLGDSLVLSVQVPFAETFTEELERQLNARRPGDATTSYRVINAGVQGYGPVEELLFFRRLVTSVQPDLVLVSVFVGNDAEEALASASKLVPDRPAIERLRETIVTWLRRTVRRSMVLQVLRLRVVAATQRFTTTAGPPEPPHQSYAAVPASRIARGMELTRDLFGRLASEASAAGARTGIILMPARFQIDDDDYGRLRDIVAAAGGELRRDAATERFSAALGTLDVPQLDLLPALRDATPGEDLFFKENIHLTRRGHIIVGHAIARFIDDQALLNR